MADLFEFAQRGAAAQAAVDALGAGKPAAAYPAGPGHAGTDTSKAAAAAIAPHTSRVARIILAHIRESMDTPNQAQRGMTADQVEMVTGLRAQTITGRIRELVMSGDLFDGGGRRATRRGRAAIIWEIPPAGHQAPSTRRQDERKAATAFYQALHRLPQGARLAFLGQGVDGRWSVILGHASHPRDILRAEGCTATDAINAAVAGWVG